jgi:apolipoprotein N-acyltransferase
MFGGLLYLIRFGEPWGADLVGPRLSTAATVLIPAFAWVALDLLRAKLDPGGSWGPLFLTQADTPASELAELGGPWLVTLAIVGFNYGLALLLVRRRPAPVLVAAAGLAAALVIAAAVDDGGRAGRTVTVAAVQPGYDTAEDETEPRLLRYWDEGTFNLAARDVVRDLGVLTRRAARDGAELVVWPEAVAFVDLRERDGARSALARVAERNGVTVVAPYFDHASRTGAAFAVAPSGAYTAPRPKQRAMWFLGEERGGATDPTPLRAAGARVGTLLGVDVQDPDLAGQLADAEAEMIVSSTHDWRQLAPQHRALASLGAAASGVPVVRADWRYGSAVYARDGSPIADAGEDRRRTVVVAAVDPGSPTPYARLGDVVGWASLAIAATAWLATWAASIATRRRRIPAWDSAS